MADVNVVYTLATPAGTLTFNSGSGDYYWLNDIQGMDAPQLRTQVQGMPARDGAVVFDAYQEAIYPVFSGEITHSTFSARATSMQNMATYLASILRADGTLTWTPQNGGARQRSVRLIDGPSFSPGIHKTFQFALVDDDPLAYSTTLTTGANITFNGANVNHTNAGDTATWPTLQLFGGVSDGATALTFQNVTTGATLSFAGSGISIASGDYIEIDTRLETVRLNSTGAFKTGSVTTGSTFWQLAPGVNALKVTGVIGAGTPKGVAIFRSAYAS